MTDFSDDTNIKATLVNKAEKDRAMAAIYDHLYVEFDDPEVGFIAGPHSVEGTYAVGGVNPDNDDEWLIVWGVPEDHPTLNHVRALAGLTRLADLIDAFAREISDGPTAGDEEDED